MTRRLTTAALIVTGVAAWAPAQAQVNIEAPAGAGTWVLRISTTGGIMGQGAPVVVITSDGRQGCARAPVDCPPVLGAAALRSLHDQIRLAAGEGWLTVPANTLCRDCLTTTMRLTLHNGDGTTTMMTAAWDPTTRGRLAAAIGQLHDLVARLAQPLTR